jgi:chemotaxis methyl-accepting protein methylase
VLRPGGFLVLGSAEDARSIDSSFILVQIGKTAVFQNTGGAS